MQYANLVARCGGGTSIMQESPPTVGFLGPVYLKLVTTIHVSKW